MTPEKMSAWVTKVVPGGRSLVLAHDQAVGQALVVATWMREDVDECVENNRSIGAQVLDAAQDHADSVGEGCRFSLQWKSDTGQTLRAIVHRAAPSERPANEHALHAEFVSPNAMIGQLLSHISQQQRVINGSIGAVLSAYERALHMQTKTIDQQNAMLAASRAELQQTTVGSGDVQLAQLKTEALRKFVDLGPDVMRMAIAAFGARVGVDLDAAAELGATGANGAAHVS